ncbi:diguanylate cyclase domain-containing protein [Candidatus Nitrotoga arctica]|uniref:Diguanylate cyclase n=1 Tax=Candidatus Nitrotoga arctica TaxID=453162 RepID=A0ABM8YW22_9PROT|nr:diguanylate cyclase [Candidatus Nitrotoga arctica]CAG9931618.1 putative Diguanylate cyclase [Candidatus Nitrotoga arctica]
MVSRSDILNANVLIVDDQDVNIRLLEHMLSGAGYVSVTSTTNPFDVCELYRKNRYDLVLLDLQMPRMDGFQVMESLKEIELDNYLPVLVITAQPTLELRALQAGAKDFISKPFNVAETLARVHNLLEVRLLHKKVHNHAKVQESRALHDSLTGLANRQLLADRISQAITHAQRNKNAMALLYVDLDGFKQINDTFGHDGGDLVLKLVASRLVAAVRQEDTVARLGGDEFVIVMWQISSAVGASIAAEKMIQILSQPYSIHGQTVNMTASIGVSIYSVHGRDAEALSKSADLALYDAKHAGRNNYRISNRIDL